MAAATYDAIVIGGGHNGLVTACYLARAKWKVLVLERRSIVGGACVTEETIFPGFKVSTAAYVNSLFRPEIIRDLRLGAYGFEVVERNPSSFSPFEDGRSLTLGPDEAANLREIAKFSTADARNYPRYLAMLERVATIIEPTLVQTPPNVVHPGAGDLLQLGRLGLDAKKLDGSLGEALEILTGAARPILDRWFESEQLKATLATDAIIGAFAAPSMPGTAYVLFHHVMGETNGARGVWSYVRGGMGGITQALARAAGDLGVEIRTDAEVSRILVEDGRAAGVALEGGEEFRSRTVASNVDCRLTFETFLDATSLPPDFLAEIRRIDYSSASVKINVALDALPDFTAAPGREHRARVRQREIRPAIGGSDRGVHDPVVGRSDRRAARQTPDVDVLPICAVQTRRRSLGRRQERRFRRPLLCDRRAVRAGVHRLGHRAPSAQPGRSRAHLQSDRRQHLPRRDEPEPPVHVPAGARLRRLSHAGSALVPLRCGGASRRRRHGGRRLECGPRDAQAPLRVRASARLSSSPGARPQRR